MPIRVWTEETEVYVRCSSPEILRDCIDRLTGHEPTRQLPHRDRVDVDELLPEGREVIFDSEGGFRYE